MACHKTPTNLDSGMTYFQMGVLQFKMKHLSQSLKYLRESEKIFQEIFKGQDKNKYILKVAREISAVEKEQKRELVKKAEKERLQQA